MAQAPRRTPPQRATSGESRHDTGPMSVPAVPHPAYRRPALAHSIIRSARSSASRRRCTSWSTWSSVHASAMRSTSESAKRSTCAMLMQSRSSLVPAKRAASASIVRPSASSACTSAARATGCSYSAASRNWRRHGCDSQRTSDASLARFTGCVRFFFQNPPASTGLETFISITAPSPLRGPSTGMSDMDAAPSVPRVLLPSPPGAAAAGLVAAALYYGESAFP
ncbi:hypothetical protein MXAN_1122 [Myxococcus xanthus DK 1622]|uniref:Uncharacterized protein n=1 Tax=Myxococcus xanthus (strain DK1622) TaxID=246197 RepID=Q1DD92_MYXXD|nr:hypothetical protein MXAN_1122 [Myxococcus xanthus DK 1622]